MFIVFKYKSLPICANKKSIGISFEVIYPVRIISILFICCLLLKHGKFYVLFHSMSDAYCLTSTTVMYSSQMAACRLYTGSNWSFPM